VHGYQEIDRPEFWEFVDAAIKGFGKFADRARQNPEDLMPWKVLGPKWHFARRGFAIGHSIEWDAEVLEELCEPLGEVCAQGQFLWNNKQVVPVYVRGQHEPWAAVQTKKTDAVYLHLTGPKGRFPLGRVMGLGHDPQLDGQRPDVDVIRLKFRAAEELTPDLKDFLREHLAAVSEAAQVKG
jgi:excinuclease ABC subunit A